jgi:hypothetical protein
MLTLDLVDRLVASTLVPRDAKFAAVESWRRELVTMRGKHHDRRLEQRLAEASRLLAPRPWARVREYLSGAFARGAGTGLAVPYPRQ